MIFDFVSNELCFGMGFCYHVKTFLLLINSLYFCLKLKEVIQEVSISFVLVHQRTKRVLDVHTLLFLFQVF